MKRIIVPTDFSACALSALKVAAKIADRTDAKITLVHTYEIPVYGFTGAQIMYDGKELAKIKHEINDELQKIARMDFVKKHVVERVLLPEHSIDQIAEHKSLKNADLIVMGTHGARGIKEDLIGSNTEKVIRKAKCPVLAVREDTGDNFNPKNAVFASNFYGEIYDRFPIMLAFAKIFGTKIHLLQVNTPTDFMTTGYSKSLIKSFQKKFKLNDATVNIYNDETIEDGVINFGNEIKADLIALETHGRTGINHIINGSIAENIANNSSIPVMTFRIKEAPKPRGVIFPD